MRLFFLSVTTAIYGLLCSIPNSPVNAGPVAGVKIEDSTQGRQANTKTYMTPTTSNTP